MELNVQTKKRWKKVIFWLFIVFIVSFLSLLIAIPTLISSKILNTHVDFSTVYKAEDYGLSAEKLTLETADQLKVMAYEVGVENPKAVVIFLSGIHNPSVTAFYGHAAMLKEQRYASILLEMRAHGESEGDVIGVGFTEVQDVQAVVDYIQKQEKYNDVPIVLYGLSLGGAVAINATGMIPEVDGLMSFSSFASYEDMFVDNMRKEGAPEAYITIQKPFIQLYTMMKFGIKRSDLAPEKQIQNLRERPALIYHSKEDSQINYHHFETIMENAPSHVEKRVVDGDKHFPTEDLLNPKEDKEYEEMMLNFLDKHFNNNRGN